MEKIEKLTKLGELKSSGIINQEEFDKLKLEVINGFNGSSNVSGEDKEGKLFEELGNEEIETPDWVEDNKKRLEELNNIEPVKRTIGDKLHDGLCNFLSLFVSEKTSEEQAAESAYRMSYDPWMKRAFKNFKDA